MPVQVESIMAGDGKHYPYERQTVTLHYVGYLDRAGERKFDSTFERGMRARDRAAAHAEGGRVRSAQWTDAAAAAADSPRLLRALLSLLQSRSVVHAPNSRRPASAASKRPRARQRTR